MLSGVLCLRACMCGMSGDGCRSRKMKELKRGSDNGNFSEFQMAREHSSFFNGRFLRNTRLAAGLSISISLSLCVCAWYLCVGTCVRMCDSCGRFYKR